LQKSGKKIRKKFEALFECECSSLAFPTKLTDLA